MLPSIFRLLRTVRTRFRRYSDTSAFSDLSSYSWPTFANFIPVSRSPFPSSPLPLAKERETLSRFSEFFFHIVDFRQIRALRNVCFIFAYRLDLLNLILTYVGEFYSRLSSTSFTLSTPIGQKARNPLAFFGILFSRLWLLRNWSSLKCLLYFRMLFGLVEFKTVTYAKLICSTVYMC